MIEQTFTFRNFKGEERTETHYFHISQTDVLTTKQGNYDRIIELGKELESRVERITEIEDKKDERGSGSAFNEDDIFLSESTRLMAQLLESVIDISYGVLSDDGDRFIKSEQDLNNFKSSMAYDHMMTIFMENPDKLTLFVTKVMGS